MSKIIPQSYPLTAVFQHSYKTFLNDIAEGLNEGYVSSTKYMFKSCRVVGWVVDRDFRDVISGHPLVFFEGEVQPPSYVKSETCFGEYQLFEPQELEAFEERLRLRIRTAVAELLHGTKLDGVLSNDQRERLAELRTEPQTVHDILGPLYGVDGSYFTAIPDWRPEDLDRLGTCDD